MPKAAIVYRSRTGTTRRYAEEIGAHLARHGMETYVVSLGDCDMARLGDADLLFLGCWTNGWFVVNQHPDKPWLDFAYALPHLARPRVALFTTYRLVTGSMFSRMRTPLVGRIQEPTLQLKSRDGRLSEADRAELDRFLAWT